MSDLYQELDHVFTKTISELDGLVECLKEEREAVIDSDLKKMAEVYKAKHERLVALHVLDTSRQGITKSLAESLGIKGAPTIESIANRLPDASQRSHLKERLSCVKSLAQAVQEFNAVQQQFLAHSLTQVQLSLRLFDNYRLGDANVQAYGSKGDYVGGSDHNALMDRTI